MYVSSSNYYNHYQIPDEGEEVNCYFLEENKYIPVYAVLLSNGIRNIEGFQYYFDFKLEGELSASNTIRSIKQHLYYSSRVVKISLSTYKYLHIATGVIFDENNIPLLLYVYPSDEILNKEVCLEFNSAENQKEKAQKILLSSKLLTDSSYSSLYRRLHKEILLSCYEKGIEVIIMSSENIQKNAFKKVLETSSNFSSISVLERYLKEEIPKSLYSSAEELKDLKDYEFPLVEVTESVLLEPEVFVEEDTTNISEELPIEEEALLYGGWEEDMEIEANQTETYIAPDWGGIEAEVEQSLTGREYFSSQVTRNAVTLINDYVLSADPADENSRGIIAINPVDPISFIPIRQRGEATVLLVDE